MTANSLNDAEVLNAPGVLIIVADAAGAFHYLNQPAIKRLGLHGPRGTPAALWDIADPDTVRRLLGAIDADRPADDAAPERITLRDASGQSVPLQAIVSPMRNRDGAGAPLLRIAAIDDALTTRYVSELEHTAELLHGFIEASTEAMWCIEYTEPVDLAEAESEIVRQVFENDCHWSLCNRAMARLYNLPDDLDFNRQRVSAYFRRSPENEAFVRELAASGFSVDAALSMDVRHDGSIAYMENSVRGHIENGKMLRMWGTVRDTTEMRTTQNRIAQREREVREVLAALPDAVLVVDKTQRALAINPAFESAFGWRADEILGRSIAGLFDLDEGGEQEHRWFSQATLRRNISVTHRDGSRVPCDLRIAPMNDDEHRRFVLSLRPEAAGRDAERADNTVPRARRRKAVGP